MPWRAAASCSTKTWCPCSTASRAAAGVMPMRYSWTLISFGTPMRMAGLRASRRFGTVPSSYSLRHRKQRLGLGHVLHVLGERFEAARHGAAVGPIQQLHRVGDGNVHAAGELRDAADVAGRHQIGAHGADVGHLAVAQVGG